MRPEVVGSRKLPMYTRGGSPYRLIWVSTAPVLVSPKTSFRIRSSRIHFSPSDRGEEMNAWRTNPKGRLQGGYICLGSWLMGRLSLRFLSHARPKKTYFSGGKYWGRGLEVRSPPPRGPELFSYNMKWEGESPCFWCRMMTPLQGWVQIRRKRNLESNEERDQPAKNVSKCSELDWPSIFDLP